MAQFREFLEITAQALGGGPHGPPRVPVGIDELDKIESAEQAQAFLNEIKGLFGVPGCQFLVSVSGARSQVAEPAAAPGTSDPAARSGRVVRSGA